MTLEHARVRCFGVLLPITIGIFLNGFTALQGCAWADEWDKAYRTADGEWRQTVRAIRESNDLLKSYRGSVEQYAGRLRGKIDEPLDLPGGSHDAALEGSPADIRRAQTKKTIRFLRSFQRSILDRSIDMLSEAQTTSEEVGNLWQFAEKFDPSWRSAGPTARLESIGSHLEEGASMLRTVCKEASLPIPLTGVYLEATQLYAGAIDGLSARLMTTPDRESLCSEGLTQTKQIRAFRLAAQGMFAGENCSAYFLAPAFPSLRCQVYEGPARYFLYDTRDEVGYFSAKSATEKVYAWRNLLLAPVGISPQWISTHANLVEVETEDKARMVFRRLSEIATKADPSWDKAIHLGDQMVVEKYGCLPEQSFMANYFLDERVRSTVDDFIDELDSHVYVRGVVSDGETGEPIADASIMVAVSANSTTTCSDVGGEWAILTQSYPGSPYTLVVEADGYRSFRSRREFLAKHAFPEFRTNLYRTDSARGSAGSTVTNQVADVGVEMASSITAELTGVKGPASSVEVPPLNRPENGMKSIGDSLSVPLDVLSKSDTALTIQREEVSKLTIEGIVVDANGSLVLEADVRAKGIQIPVVDGVFRLEGVIHPIGEPITLEAVIKTAGGGEFRGGIDVIPNDTITSGVVIRLGAVLAGLSDTTLVETGTGPSQRDDLDDAIDDIAVGGEGSVSDLIALFLGAVSHEQTLWEAFNEYAGAFDQRLRELGFDACDDQEVNYIYVQTREIHRQHEPVLADLVEAYTALKAALVDRVEERPDLDSYYHTALPHRRLIHTRFLWMGKQLLNDYGCNIAAIERRGEFVAEAFADPDDIYAGIKGMDPYQIEICGDGIDNDGDFDIDECDAGCCEDRVVAILSDCSSTLANVFLVQIDSRDQRVCPGGGSVSLTEDLGSGPHVVRVHVLSATEGSGRYCLSVTVNGNTALDIEGETLQGTSEVWPFDVP